MSWRKVSVQATASFEFEIDDERVSDWDGAKILEVLEKRGKGNDIYTADATLENLLAHLGIALSIENRSMNIDGWADFPPDSAKGNPYGVDWAIESVEVDGEQVKA